LETAVFNSWKLFPYNHTDAIGYPPLAAFETDNHAVSNPSTSSAERCLAVIELLVSQPDGLAVSVIATQLSLPLSATHRLLQALVATGSIRYDPISGRSVPLHTTAMGKACLATMDEAKALADVRARGFDGELVTPNAARTVEELRRRIRATRRLGYGLNEQESEVGLSAIAMVVRDRHRDDAPVVGAISSAGPSFRIDRACLEGFVQPLREAVAQVEELWPVRAHASGRHAA
jgi:DNA-binding IclR family transcriptional regulator